MNIIKTTIISTLTLVLSILGLKILSRLFLSEYISLEGINFWLALIVIFIVLRAILAWLFENK